MSAGELAMWQPTVVTLQHLETVESPDDLAAAGSAAGGVAGPTGLTGARTFPTDWAGGIEGRRGATVVAGERAWVVVDPADPTGATTDEILSAARVAGAELAAVLVTGLEPERHAGVELFATGLGLPVAGPPGAAGRVPYAITELGSGTVPFGDAPIAVEAIDPGRLEASAIRGSARDGVRWADRAGRLRLRPAGGGQEPAGG
jgi:glyoxylase-like metal-dependent hydrolase (beta-lactamase superfamily II)